MKQNIIAILIAGVFTVAAGEVLSQDKPEVNTQQETPVKIIEYIPGTWVIQSVYRGKENVTTTDTLAAIETIEFNREGRYMSYSGTEKIDSGAYRLNEQHGILYMASENRDDKPVEWKVRFTKDGNMTITMKDSDKKLENINFVYRRSGPETSSNRKN
jgi:hypothetical protein